VIVDEATDERKMQFSQEQFMFLRTMGHELRSPLNSILGTSEMMVNAVYGEMPEKQLKAAQRIFRNSHRLLNIINAVMLYIRAEANVLEFNSLPLVVKELLEQCIAAVQERATAKGLTLELTIQPVTVASVQGDPDQLAFIINELLTNAITFTQAGTIQLQAASVDADHWKIIVSDSGVGIPPEEMAHVFTPFWRGPDVKQYTQEGDGLGLSIVREFLRLMNGTIDIQSQAGTTVTVTLPTSIPANKPV